MDEFAAVIRLRIQHPSIQEVSKVSIIKLLMARHCSAI
jgi:hypothetical protein